MRQYFPNIDQPMASIFVHIAKNALAGITGFDIVPLQDVIVLSPWSNTVNSESLLKQLSQFVVPRQP